MLEKILRADAMPGFGCGQKGRWGWCDAVLFRTGA